MEIQSLQDLKDKIKECRDAMAGLSSESEEYKALAKESSEAQSKLNEVMADSKYSTDEAANSYNALAQEMAALKKAWKETGDEAERVKLGTQIKEINDKLKDMDASIGNFQRNVGNYEGAFEEAFKTMIDGAGGLGGKVGEIAGVTKKLIPLIKSASTAATTGLAGVKKAIASTGIGLLIVAVGELAAHWDDIIGAMKKFIGVGEEDAKVAKGIADELERAKKAAQDTNTQLQFTTSLMAAQGASRLEQLKAQRDEYLRQYKEYGEKWSEKDNALKTWGGAYGTTQEWRDNVMAAREEYANLRKEAGENYDKILNEIKVEEAAQETAAKNMIKADEDYLKSAIQLENERYEKELATAKQYNLDTEAIEKAHQKKLKEIREQNSKSNSKSSDDSAKREAEAIAERARKSQMTELEILDETYAAEQKKLEGNNEALLNLEKEYNDKRNKILNAQYAKELSDKEKAYDKSSSVDKFNAEHADYSSVTSSGDSPAMQEIKMEQAKADAIYDINKKLIEDKIALLNEELNHYDENSDEYKATAQSIADYEETLRQNKIVKDEEDAEYTKKVAEETANMQMVALEKQQEKVAHIFDTINFYNDSLTSTFSNLVSMMESAISAEESSGDETEKSSKRKQKALKALKVVETTVSVASIAANAAQSIMSIWQGYAAETAGNNLTAAATGPAFAPTKAALDAKSLTSAILKTTMIGTTATASIASAIAGTVSSIKSMNASSTASSTISTPTVSEYQPNYTSNLTSESDTDNLANAMTKANIWVSVTDINNAQVKVSQRDNESTF